MSSLLFCFSLWVKGEVGGRLFKNSQQPEQVHGPVPPTFFKLLLNVGVLVEVVQVARQMVITAAAAAAVTADRLSMLPRARCIISTLERVAQQAMREV